jgi:hypothetical protein
MKRWTTVLLALVMTLTVIPAAAQLTEEDQRALRSRIEDRYNIVPLEAGIALTPKTRVRDVRLIEISEGVIAINGVPVSGQELRERVGDDASAIVRLSYLSADQRRELFGGPGATAAPRRNGRDEPVERETSSGRRRSTGQRVRIFGDVVVDESESIRGEAVAVIGSVRVNGEVGSEVVAVLGSVDLGPKAVVHGDVVSVGGRIRRAPGSQIRGGVTEVSLGDIGMHVNTAPWMGPYQWRVGGFDELPRLMVSSFRLLLLVLFAGIAFVIARPSVEGSAQRVGDNAPKALLVGLAAELLLGPVFVLTALVLVLTIVGIPLLLLLPFGVIVLLLMALAGFTGTASTIGRAARQRFGQGGQPGFMDVVVGILIILSPLLLGRFIAMAGWVAGPFVWLLVLTGTAFEFLAWTTGFGAMLMNTFSRWRGRRLARGTAPVTTT